MADPWDPAFGDDFMDLDDDNLTADALHRFAQLDEIEGPDPLIPNQSNAFPDAPGLRECKLFLAVGSIEGIPSEVGCFANCHKIYKCEVEVAKVTTVFPLSCRLEGSPDNGIEALFMAARPFDKSAPSWSLAEYYGETKIIVRLKVKKTFREVTVGSMVMRLCDLMAKQQETNIQEISPDKWSIQHKVSMLTTLKDERRTARPSASSWLETAKSAHNSLAVASSTATGINIAPERAEKAEKQKLSWSQTSRAQGGARYRPLARDGQGHRKGTVVTVNLEFRIVPLQNCLTLCLPTVWTRPSTLQAGGGSSRSARHSPPPSPSPAPAPSPHADAGPREDGKEFALMSELHYLAVTAPATMVVEVMRALSRKDALPQAMELKHQITSEPASGTPPVGGMEGTSRLLRPRRSHASTINTAAVGPGTIENTSGLSAFELALLHGQEATTLEMLQRCGGLCFGNTTVGRASPLHAAVRGGSATCVELVARYLRKYGARRVTGPGVRLWTSSMSAKLEWRDAADDTALAVACRQPPSPSAHAIAIYLLILGADAAAVNSLTNYTPLMYAAQYGPAELVGTLLSIVKSQQDVLDGILNVGDVNSILNNTTNLDVDDGVRDEIQAAIASAAHAARSGALANHLHSNPRSNNILRGRNAAEGGHFNPLSTYTCDPCRREASRGRTALHLAVQRGDAAITQMLLDIGMSCAEADYHGDNTLHMAARRGDHALLGKLVEAERREWAAYKELVRQGKSLELMRHRTPALLRQNCLGDAPMDLALEGRHFAAADELLKGLVKAYGAIPEHLAASWFQRLTVCAAEVTHTPSTPTLGTDQSEQGRKASKATDSMSSEERHIAACLKTLAGSLSRTPAASPSCQYPGPAPSSPSAQSLPSTPAAASPKLRLPPGGAAQEAGAIDMGPEEERKSDSAEGKEDGSEGTASSISLYDNLADSVEYMLALSPLGLKFIADTAGGAAISYLPQDPVRSSGPAGETALVGARTNTV